MKATEFEQVFEQVGRKRWSFVVCCWTLRFSTVRDKSSNALLLSSWRMFSLLQRSRDR